MTRERRAHRSHPAERAQRCAVGREGVPLVPARPGMLGQHVHAHALAPLWPGPVCAMARPRYGSTAAAEVPDQALAQPPEAPGLPVAALRKGGQSGAPGICVTLGTPDAGCEECSWPHLARC